MNRNDLISKRPVSRTGLNVVQILVFVVRGELNTEPCSFAARVCHILSSFIFLIDAIHGSHGPVR